MYWTGLFKGFYAGGIWSDIATVPTFFQAQHKSARSRWISKTTSFMWHATDRRINRDRHITFSADVTITYFREMKERLFQEVFGAADVLGDSVGGVVAATESGPFLGTQASSVVAPTWISTCRTRDNDTEMINSDSREDNNLRFIVQLFSQTLQHFHER